MILLEPSFITSYWLVPFLYFCFIVKKEAIRKELKFYGRSLSIAASHNSVTKKKKIITITISAKKEKKRLYNANVKRTFPETVCLYPVLLTSKNKIPEILYREFTIFRSINTLEAGTRQLVRSIELWAFTRLRSSRLTWPRNVTRTTITSISIPTNRCSQSRSTMGSPYFLSPLPTQEWICIYCR